MFEKIAVHNSVFHADDVVAVAAIEVLYGIPEEIVRIPSRDDEKQEKARQDGFTLVDIGGGEFDHHGAARDWQYNNGIYLSALGKVLKQAVRDGKLAQKELDIMLFNGLYDLQAKDNGQDFDGVPSPFGFIRWLNNDDVENDTFQIWLFRLAIEMATKVFTSMLKDARKSIPEHEECVKAFKAMGENGIANFPHYMRHGVLECQRWNDVYPEKEVKFFTFPMKDGYRIQGVNKVGSFKLNHELKYKGLRNEELNAAAGIDDGIFVHVTGFLGGADSLESCYKLAGV